MRSTAEEDCTPCASPSVHTEMSAEYDGRLVRSRGAIITLCVFTAGQRHLPSLGQFDRNYTEGHIVALIWFGITDMYSMLFLPEQAPFQAWVCHLFHCQVPFLTRNIHFREKLCISKVPRIFSLRVQKLWPRIWRKIIWFYINAYTSYHLVMHF